MSRGQMCGRTTRELRPIWVNQNMPLTDLVNLFEQQPMSSSSVRPLEECLNFANPIENRDGVLPEVYGCLSLDDCESSMLMARLAKMCLMHFNSECLSGKPGERVQMLKERCAGWRVFGNFTENSWKLMGSLEEDICAMLGDGRLKVMTGVGLASNASAGDVAGAAAHLTGHCFNVGYYRNSASGDITPFLLEGTTAMYSLYVDDQTPRVQVTFTDGQGQKIGEPKRLDMPTFLSALSSTLVMLVTVVNKQNGTSDWDKGCELPVEVPGWIGKTVVIPTLDSKNTDLSFYQRVMYMGWPCTEGGQGCMPVQEREGVLAGCHPFDLAKPSIRGVDAGMQPEEIRLMGQIMEEVVPPQAPESVVRKIADVWTPCRPIETVNTQARSDGARCHRVACMESPCAPEYLSIIHEMKRRLVDEANRINDARADSDGCKLHAMVEGVDSLVCVDVPDRNIEKLTVIESVRQAQLNLKWPTRKPVAAVAC